MSDEFCWIGGFKYKIGAHGFVYTMLLGEWQRTTAVDAETVKKSINRKKQRV
ncbi:MAG: hypothetical protein KAT90_10375 [Gammaproteobacteria bacterium]|nr:hypothetical protein [Gammaproteobacteria bacterium]